VHCLEFLSFFAVESEGPLALVVPLLLPGLLELLELSLPSPKILVNG